ncbi:16S rRNA (guanine(966)-N(2))-methyltransferase RsmD [Paenibacillus selenitireducens]|uniref:16S rRNA (Guanine(966)-N(2))-methyltransferase RsmD n=1 Tax=Paenibacillus selenitireducens TaxID=1324314 RepID=A0A1T2XD88_9BACL|nr:16S rRNA (guanine(966)-N(2))-methyltransferase RsmD [Paenibacillus selenitireducens]OPA77849.1 16S rRNA (guanine(966)-N(2))-methyltransferase RsmD [Paenibacillus selenitireducens]
MRVISGTAKGRPLKAVPGMGTRPTTDKVKEAVFSIIGPYFDGGRVLDLFAGTGGLGIEALSRGAERAVFVDMDPKSIEVIRQNLKTAKLENQAEVYRNEATRAIKALEKRGGGFDLIFLDPPYKMTQVDEMMMDLAQRGLVQDQAVIMVEHDADHTYPEQVGPFRSTRVAHYGETTISIYRYEKEEQA